MESYDVLIVPDSLWSFFMNVYVLWSSFVNMYVPISSLDMSSNLDGVNVVGVEVGKGKKAHDVDVATGYADSALASRASWVTPCTRR